MDPVLSPLSLLSLGCLGISTQSLLIDSGLAPTDVCAVFVDLGLFFFSTGFSPLALLPLVVSLWYRFVRFACVCVLGFFGFRFGRCAWVFF